MARPSGISVLLLALAAGGCDNSQAPCTQGCPDISGVYSLEDSVPVGNCPFSPYLLAPSVELQQSSERRKVVLHVIDPTTQVEVPLSGDVYMASTSDMIGSFRIDTRTTRLANRTSEQTVTLDVLATGVVSLRDGHRVLSATLSTTDALSNQACTTTLTVTGQSQ
ncbi:hypothetical protein [Melittangium boletus]|uniref:Lipoprotein n=1 Tax=Melittangium boletus DSM 14713 TaxID=1294270 RepID=A0A250IDJ2_9BACT|nr:hypothetical protein [Melittangium boletus]ATB29934.1 hypothetical protein MEBOL_003389 [Melittangium boletus DSM 14713]